MAKTPSSSSAKTRCARSERASAPRFPAAAWIALLCLQAWPLRIASAQPDPAADRERASEHFDRGIALVERGQYREAAEAFEAAYRLSQERAVLYNLGMAYAAAQQPVAAAETLARYLESEPDAISADERTRILAEIERQRARIGSLTVELLPLSALLSIDGTPRPTSTQPVSLEVGAHRLQATLHGYEPLLRTITIRAGERTNLKFVLRRIEVALPRSNPPEEPPRTAAGAGSSRWQVLAYAFAGAGLAAGATSLGLYVDSNDRFGSWRNQRATLELQAQGLARRPPDTAAVLSLQEQASKNDDRLRAIRRQDTVALSLGIGAAVLLACAVSMFVLGGPAERVQLAWHPRAFGPNLVATY